MSIKSIPDSYAQLSLFTDISAYTDQRQRDFAPVTKIFRENNISYSWGFPTKLLITYQGKSVFDVQLHHWGIVPNASREQFSIQNPLYLGHWFCSNPLFSSDYLSFFLFIFRVG